MDAIEVHNKINFEELPITLVNGYSKIMRECIHSFCLKEWSPNYEILWPDPWAKDGNQRYFDIITEVLKAKELP